MSVIGAIRVMIYNEIFYSKRILSEINIEYRNKGVNGTYDFIKEGGIDNWIEWIVTSGKTVEEMDLEIKKEITKIEDLIIRQGYSSELLNKLFNK